MESDLSVRLGRPNDAESLSPVTPNVQNNEYRNMRNVSLQTGEEFSPEFLRDRVPKRTPFTDDVNHTATGHSYKDLTGKGFGFDLQHQRKFSSDFDRGSPSAMCIYSSNSPNSNHHCNSKGSGNLDCSFSGKIKFLCSFGGRILPRPNDSKLRYVGGDTRIISIKKDLTYNELVKKTTGICNYQHTIKYQLPGEDLDALISVSSDEDLHHMIDEYRDLERKSQRLRIFLVSNCDPEGLSSSETKPRQKEDTEYQYVVAVNGVSPHRSSSRESLESPTIQKELSSVNLKMMLPGLGYNAPAQFKDPKTEFVRTYENAAASPYVYTSNYPRVVDKPSGNEGPGFIDPAAQMMDSPGQVGYMVQSRAAPLVSSHFLKPSNESQPPLLYNPSDVPLQCEKSVPSNEVVSLTQGERTGKTVLSFPGNNNQLSQESPNIDMDYIECGKDINWTKYNDTSFVLEKKKDAVFNNDYAEFLEQKKNLPQIICHPKEQPVNYQITSNKPDFLIKSQKAEGGLNLPEDESSLGIYSSVFPETTMNDVLGGHCEGNVHKENIGRNSHEELDINNGTFVNSCSSEKLVIDEHSDGSGSVAYGYEDDDDKGDVGYKEGSIHNAAFIEIEASIHGLQIIKNKDLEELQELGSGTFGTVYHGKWRGTDVAIKRIKKSCFSGCASEQERLTKDFWSEAKILSRIHHPNIVAFYGVVSDGPGATLATVSEYMANGSLRHVLSRKDRALDRRKKTIIALDASFGMEYLHLKNIVHFDLKCDNLLVNLGDTQRPICKVTDFGLSRIKQNTLVSGGVRGTLPWMAPELLNGNSIRVSEKVDVFSFGIALWEILTGEEPYIDLHCGAIIGGIVNNTLRPLIPERCDPEWRKLMEECWSHDPAERPSFTEITKRLLAMSTTLHPKRFTNRVKR